MFIASFGPPGKLTCFGRERSGFTPTDSMQELSGNDLFIEKPSNF